MKKTILFIAILISLVSPVSAYECWKGENGTAKEGQYGTTQEGEYVPDSTTVSCSEYDTWVLTQTPEVTPTPNGTVYEDVEVPVSALPTATQTAISAIAGAGAAILVRRVRV